MRPISHLRWYIAGLLFLATVINYIDRQTLSVVAPALTEELKISNVQYSNILTAFLVPYSVMYVFSGMLVDWWGTRKSLAAFMAWWSVANALHATARGALGLGIFRFLLGAGESGNFMAAEKAISEWYPPKERAFANGLVNAAAATGAIISPPLIAWMTIRYGWRVAFVLTGALGFVWLLAWLVLYEVPERHKRISPSELSLVREFSGGRAGSAGSPAERIRWVELLRFRQTWGLLLARFLADPVWWFYLFWLPKYLKDVRGFSMAEIGMVAWLPYLTADLGSLSGGFLSGFLIRRKVPILKARKIIMWPCVLLMPLGVVVGFTPSSSVALAIISLVTFCHMAWKTNLMTMTNDIYPTRVVGSVAGIVGTGTGLGGAVFTALVGRIIDAFSYGLVFIIMGFLHPIAMGMVHLLVKRRVSAAVS